VARKAGKTDLIAERQYRKMALVTPGSNLRNQLIDQAIALKTSARSDIAF